jgi:hypothetical protein
VTVGWRELLNGDLQNPELYLVTCFETLLTLSYSEYRRHIGTDNGSVSDAGLNGDASNDEHSISSDAAADLTQDGDSMDSEREALNLVSGLGFSCILLIVICLQVGLTWWSLVTVARIQALYCETYVRVLVTVFLS